MVHVERISGVVSLYSCSSAKSVSMRNFSYERVCLDCSANDAEEEEEEDAVAVNVRDGDGAARCAAACFEEEVEEEKKKDGERAAVVLAGNEGDKEAAERPRREEEVGTAVEDDDEEEARNGEAGKEGIQRKMEKIVFHNRLARSPQSIWGSRIRGGPP